MGSTGTNPSALASQSYNLHVSLVDCVCVTYPIEKGYYVSSVRTLYPQSLEAAKGAYELSTVPCSSVPWIIWTGTCPATMSCRTLERWLRCVRTRFAGEDLTDGRRIISLTPHLPRQYPRPDGINGAPRLAR